MKNIRLLTITLLILLIPASGLSQKVETAPKKDHSKIKNPGDFNLSKNALESGNWVFESNLKSTNTAVKPEYASYKISWIVKYGDSCYLELPGTDFRNNLDDYSIWCKTKKTGTKIDRQGRITEQMSIYYDVRKNATVNICLIGDGAAATVDIDEKNSRHHYSGKIIALSESEYARKILK
jgi:hypothetical protein